MTSPDRISQLAALVAELCEIVGNIQSREDTRDPDHIEYAARRMAGESEDDLNKRFFGHSPLPAPMPNKAAEANVPEPPAVTRTAESDGTQLECPPGSIVYFCGADYQWDGLYWWYGTNRVEPHIGLFFHELFRKNRHIERLEGAAVGWSLKGTNALHQDWWMVRDQAIQAAARFNEQGIPTSVVRLVKETP